MRAHIVLLAATAIAVCAQPKVEEPKDPEQEIPFSSVHGGGHAFGESVFAGLPSHVQEYYRRMDADAAADEEPWERR